MTPEELDKARVDEACRVAAQGGHGSTLLLIARLAREGWTPPKPVDPDVLAYREWEAGLAIDPIYRDKALAGEWDHYPSAKAFVAGARMARQQEQERAKVLLDELHRLAGGHKPSMNCALSALAAYKAGKEAAR